MDQDTLNQLFARAKKEPRPHCYQFINEFRRRGNLAKFHQAHLNTQLARYIRVIGGDPRVAQKLEDSGHCHGWTFTEYFNTAKNIPHAVTLADWFDAAKYEIAYWDGQAASLDEEILLPKAKQITTRRALFERIAGMVLAHHGFTVGDVTFSQARITRHHQRVTSIFTGQLEGRHPELPDSDLFFRDEFDIFADFSIEEMIRLIKHDEVASVLRTGIITLHTHDHITYLTAYRTVTGEFRFQLYDPNFSSGRLSTPDAQQVATEAVRVLGNVFRMRGSRLQVRGIEKRREPRPAPASPTVSRRLMAMLGRAPSAAAMGFLANCREDITAAYIEEFRDGYREVIDESYAVQYEARKRQAPLLIHLIIQAKVGHIKLVLKNLNPSLFATDDQSHSAWNLAFDRNQRPWLQQIIIKHIAANPEVAASCRAVINDLIVMPYSSGDISAPLITHLVINKHLDHLDIVLAQLRPRLSVVDSDGYTAFQRAKHAACLPAQLLILKYMEPTDETSLLDREYPKDRNTSAQKLHDLVLYACSHNIASRVLLRYIFSSRSDAIVKIASMSLASGQKAKLIQSVFSNCGVQGLHKLFVHSKKELAELQVYYNVICSRGDLSQQARVRIFCEIIRGSKLTRQQMTEFCATATSDPTFQQCLQATKARLDRSRVILKENQRLDPRKVASTPTLFKQEKQRESSGSRHENGHKGASHILRRRRSRK